MITVISKTKQCFNVVHRCRCPRKAFCPLVKCLEEQTAVFTTWLSLDEDDNDLARWLTCLMAALQEIESTIGESILLRMQSPDLVPRRKYTGRPS